MVSSGDIPVELKSRLMACASLVPANSAAAVPPTFFDNLIMNVESCVEESRNASEVLKTSVVSPDQ